jgi:NodT family efflux transporter outer membrane factor (OMF) lipoprotein
MMRRAAPWLLVALLGGCAAGPDFVPPVPPAATAYTSKPPRLDAAAPAQRLEPGVAPRRHWWRQWHNAELDAVVERALRGNRSVAEAGADLARARALVGVAAAARAPRVDLEAGSGRQRYGAEFLGTAPPQAPFTYYALGLDAHWDVDLAGARRRALEGQLALAEAQRQRLAAAQLEVGAEAVRLSLDGAARRAQGRALRALLQADRDALRLTQRAFADGALGAAAVLAARQRLQDDAAQLPALRQRIDVDAHALAVLVGQAPAAAPLPQPAFDALRLPRKLPLTLPSQLAARRPDIVLASARLHAATAALGVASADLYPRIELSASFVPQATSAGALFAAGSPGWSVLGGLLAPVFDGGELHARQRAARDAVRAAAAHYQGTVLRAFGQVADALQALQHDAQALAARQRALAAARAALALTRAEVDAGSVGRLPLLAAQRRCVQAEIAWIGARAQRQLDTVRLFLSIGGGENS